jgi:hypothetical protein
MKTALGGLIVCFEMTRIAHIRDFSDVAALGGSSNSKLVMSLGQRFESARRLLQFGLDKLNTRKDRSPW